MAEGYTTASKSRGTVEESTYGVTESPSSSAARSEPFSGFSICHPTVIWYWLSTVPSGRREGSTVTWSADSPWTSSVASVTMPSGDISSSFTRSSSLTR